MKIKNETYTRKPVSVGLCYRLYESFRYTQPYDKALPFPLHSMSYRRSLLRFF